MTVVKLADVRREREARLIGLAAAVTAYLNSQNALARLYAGADNIPHILEWAGSLAADKYLLDAHYRRTLAHHAAIARGDISDPPDGHKKRKSDLRFHDQALEWAQRFLHDDIWTSAKTEALR